MIELIKKNNGTIIDQVKYEKGPRALLVTLSDEKDEATFVSNLKSSSLVKYVEPNRLVYASHVPNDPRYPLQWGPKNIRAGGLPNPSAWDIESGDKNVSIAVVDTGIQYDHQDMAKFKDGKEKYKYGHDWINMDDDQSPISNLEVHGTHCTGIATAVMDNGIGIAGIAPNCTFMAERVMEMVWDWGSASWIGAGTSWNISRGIMDAADHDADVISMSFGSHNSSEFDRDATLYASNLGSILVAASGNDAEESWYKGGINYPAAYPWVIAVGAIDSQNQRANFSQWGKELALVAPGVDIVSTIPWNGYDNQSGTSMATPHVAGVAALVKSRAERWPAEPYATNPRFHLNNDQIAKVLIQSAFDLGPRGWDQEYGYGKVDAGRAVRCVNISGNVLEAVFNAPISAVEVRATSIQGPKGVYSTKENTDLARINPDGDYYIRVPPGIYHICAMAYGYMPSCGLNGERAELPAFDFNGNLYQDNRDFRLVPFPCNVTGRVINSSTGQPVSQARMVLEGPKSLIPPYPDVSMTAVTNSSGYYHFLLEYGVNDEGNYNVTASKEGYSELEQNFSLNWSKVVTNYYTCRNCRLDTRDYNPVLLNFSLKPLARKDMSSRTANESTNLPSIAETEVEKFIHDLGEENSSLQMKAHMALFSMGTAARDALINALNNSNPRIQSEAAFLLGSLGDSKAVGPLILKLRDKDIQVRSYSSWALGKITDARAVDPLIEALMDTSSLVRESAAFALSEIRDKKAVEPMIQALQREGDPYVRGQMANFLGDFNDSRAVEPLILALNDENATVRAEAAMSLGKTKDPIVLEPLIEALQDPDEAVRAAVARTLGEIGDTRAIEHLTMALNDSSSWVRESSAYALGKLNDRRATIAE